MVKKGTIDKYIPLIVIVLAIIGIPVGLSISGINPLSFFSFQSFATPATTGVQILGLSNVQITGINQANFSGKYFFAQLLVSGPFTPVTASSSSILSMLGNSNYTGTGSDSISIQTLQNQAIYQADASQGSTVLNYYSSSLYSGSFSYTNCNGATLIVSGSADTNGWSCSLGGNLAAVTSYINACHVSVASLGNGAFGVAVATNGGGAGSAAQCWQVTRATEGTVFQLSQPKQNTTVQATINGQNLVVSTQKPQYYQFNSSGKVVSALYLLPVQSGGTYFGPPSQIGVLYVNTTGRRLLEESDLSNLIAAQASINSSIGVIAKQNTLQADGYDNSFCSLTLGTSQCLYYSPTVLNANLQNNNSKLSDTAYYQPSTYSGTLVVANGTNNYNIYLNDSTFAYIRPQIEIVSSAQAFGFTFASASCSIQPISPISFKSPGPGTIAVVVKNTGTTAGSCTTTVNQSASIFTIQSLTGGSPQISAGGTNTYDFSISSTENINATSPVQFKSCNALGTSCSTAWIQVTVQSQCSNGQVLTNGQCQPVSSVTTVSTTSTTICQSLLGCGPTTSTTTTTITQVSCTSPSVFNQTLYNEHVSPPCWIPPSGFTLTVGDIVIIVGVVAVIGAVYVLKDKKHKKRK